MNNSKRAMLFDVTSNFHIYAGFCVYLTTCLFATSKFYREVALRVHSGSVPNPRGHISK